jgi:hypothetical protein
MPATRLTEAQTRMLREVHVNGGVIQYDYHTRIANIARRLHIKGVAHYTIGPCATGAVVITVALEHWRLPPFNAARIGVTLV